VKISGYMYKFQDLTPISGHFRTIFRNFRTTPGLRATNRTSSGPSVSAVWLEILHLS